MLSHVGNLNELHAEHCWLLVDDDADARTLMRMKHGVVATQVRVGPSARAPAGRTGQKYNRTRNIKTIVPK